MSFVLLTFILPLLCSGAAQFSPPGPNIALGKSYVLQPRPNYRYCTDPGDAVQLTDGEYVKGYFWVQKGCVGWRKVSPVVITIDLGRVEPIAGLSFSTAAGTAGVYWPRAIFVLTSEDGRSFHLAGELVRLSARYGMPPRKGYARHRFVTDELRTKGRFVRLIAIPSGPYLFCDEIEVYRGPDELLKQPLKGEVVRDVMEFVNDVKTDAGVRNRLFSDIEALKKLVEGSSLPDARKEELLSLLESLRSEVKGMPRVRAEGFKAIVPFNDLHRRILKVNAELLRARGFPPLTAWHRPRWDPLLPWDAPKEPPSEPPSLRIALMPGEYRSEAFCLTNASDEPLRVRMRPVGLPFAPVFHEVLFTDTQEGEIIADALPVIEGRDGELEVEIPSGMTKQIWLTFHPVDVPPGDYKGRIEIEGAPSGPIALRIELHISPLRFPERPFLSLCAWDYTDGPSYGLTPENLEAAIRDMREHFYDSPWARSPTAPWPEPGMIDEEGNIKGKLDFSKFDRWVRMWEGARRYFVFLSVKSSFAGIPMGTERFRRAVSRWASLWAEHCRDVLGLKPKQVGLLLVDEPHSREQDEVIVEWARAIKAGTDFFLIWEDPTHREPWRTAMPELFEVCDAICPNLNIFYQGGRRSAEFHAELRRKGVELWFYQCSGPARLLDPYYYHRLLAWHCFKHGAVGMGFWAYADNGWSYIWNEHTARRTIYSPVYIGEDFVVTGKHWEAVREGVEDYEYLRMLRDAARRTSDPDLARRAEKLLREAIRAVAGDFDPSLIRWSSPKDRTAADRMRAKILEMLERLEAVSRS